MARERKKSFLLYESQRSLVSLLTEPERAALLMAIYDYVATGKAEKLPTVAAEIAFAAIREQLDIDAARYYGVCAASEEKARKHRKSKKTPKNRLLLKPKKKKQKPKPPHNKRSKRLTQKTELFLWARPFAPI